MRAIFVSLSRPLRHPGPPTFLRPLRPLPVCSCVPPQQPCTRCFTDSQWTRYTLDLVRSIDDYAPKISHRTDTTENFRFSSSSFASFSFAHYCCRFSFSSTTWTHHLHLATSYTINAATGFTLKQYPLYRLLVIYLCGVGYASVHPYRRELKTDESSLRILGRTGRCVDSRNRNSIQPYRVSIRVYIYAYRRTCLPLSGRMEPWQSIHVFLSLFPTDSCSVPILRSSGEIDTNDWPPFSLPIHFRVAIQRFREDSESGGASKSGRKAGARTRSR